MLALSANTETGGLAANANLFCEKAAVAAFSHLGLSQSAVLEGAFGRPKGDQKQFDIVLMVQ
ncbi:hypothetical protein [Ferrimonas senticii]|uniref:hypothetical protein n=1 Tax=Ferrimonas senticii TaxID=394566 RepID=UPI000423350B|nr:hypothetical protein [Ferrimonas senticii]